MTTKSRTSVFRRVDWRKLLFESFLIIFSILFALFINEWRKSQELESQRKKALEMIIGELEHNRDGLERVIAYHQQSAVRLDSAASFTPLDESLFFIANRLLERGILPAELQTTAWNTAQLSGSVSLFDEQLIYALAGVYELQAKGVENTLKEIAAFYLNIDNLEATLTKQRLTMLSLYFQELASQEVFLLQRMEGAIKALQAEI